jgi:uncharacterized phage protein (TIGR02218 family)
VTAKTLAAGIGAIVDSGEGALAWGVEIIRADATALRYCTGHQRATIDGDVYTPFRGASFSSIASTVGLDVDNQKLSIGDSEDLTREDVYDGVWDGARYRLFQYDQLDPAAGIIPWHSGFIADIEPRIGAFDLEAHDLRQAAHQDTTRTFQFACPYELGDAKCRKDLTDFTSAGLTVDSVVSPQEFTFFSGQPTGWGDNGLVTFTTGDSANGVSRRITTWVSVSGLVTVTLERAAIKGITVGDQFTAIAGCRKRPNEDCRDKFANKVNYGGCDTKPTVSDLMTGEPPP